MNVTPKLTLRRRLAAVAARVSAGITETHFSNLSAKISVVRSGFSAHGLANRELWVTFAVQTGRGGGKHDVRSDSSMTLDKSGGGCC